MGTGSIYDNFLKTAELYPNKEALGFFNNKNYKVITYSNLKYEVDLLRAGMQKQGLKKGDKIGIMAANCPEWIKIDLAAASLGVVVVPIHTTFTFDIIKKIVDISGIACLFLDSKSVYNLNSKLGDLDTVQVLIENNSIGRENQFNFNDYYSKDSVSAQEVSENDLHTIIFTSGTTGEPKGVILTHKNIVSNVFAAREYIPVSSDDRFFSFLPLSHALERTAGYYAPLLHGAGVYYGRGRDTLVEDMSLAQPTILAAVPRVFEKAYEKILEKVRFSPRLKQALFNKALVLGQKKYNSGLTDIEKIFFTVLDKIVFAKIRKTFGGRLRFAVCGGAALSFHVGKFFEAVGVKILEGYGLTETSPIVSVNKPNKYKFGSVGCVLPGVEVKFGNDKEIYVKGDNVSGGYYKNEEATAESFATDGWFKTGDLGEFDEEGFLKIVGRKKEMIVLSTGKNVMPVPIEILLEENRFISQAFVYGDNKKHIAALVVPDMSALKQWCAEQKIEFQLPRLLSDERVVGMYKDEVERITNHLPHYERVQKFSLVKDEFTQENGLLTPTLKLKRARILERYRNIVS